MDDSLIVVLVYSFCFRYGAFYIKFRHHLWFLVILESVAPKAVTAEVSSKPKVD